MSRLDCQTGCMFYVEITNNRPCEFYSYDKIKRICELNSCSVFSAQAVSYSVYPNWETYVPTQV